MQQLYGSRCGGGFFFWHSVVLAGSFSRQNARASAKRSAKNAEQPTEDEGVDRTKNEEHRTADTR
jgi:hypothetical protein